VRDLDSLRGCEEVSAELCKVFGITRATVWGIVHAFQPGENPRGRPTCFSDEQEAEIVCLVNEIWKERVPLPPQDFLVQVNARFNKELTRGWLKSFMLRHTDEIKHATGSFNEAERLKVPQSYFQEYFEQAGVILEGKVADLVYNLDEVGAGHWED
jgi:hypothetical protein